MKHRIICVVVTARASYSRIKTVLKAIDKHPKLKLKIIASSSSLIENYGNVVKLIEKDGFKVTTNIYNLIQGGNLITSAKTTGLGIIELSNAFSQINPHIVVTIADRYETISTAIAASYMNIPLAHIQGGEVSGNIDEKVRHSITKLSDYHFVATKKSYHRVKKMGEDPNYIFNTGCPSIDIAHMISKSKQLDFDPYTKYGGVGNFPSIKNGYFVVLQHPVTDQFENTWENTEKVLEAIDTLKRPTLWFWPNVDAGSDILSSVIRTFRETERLQNVHFFKNMEGDDFLKLLKFSNGLIGNSSAGIRECSYLSVPAVNIGERQKNRERGKNVIDVDYSTNKIIKSIEKLSKIKKLKPDRLYGSGNSGLKIAEILSSVDLKFTKQITY